MSGGHGIMSEDIISALARLSRGQKIPSRAVGGYIKSAAGGEAAGIKEEQR